MEEELAFEHPVLGKFSGSRGEWFNGSATEVAGLGVIFRNFSICVSESQEAPSEDQLLRLVALITSDISLREHVENCYFNAYKNEIRKEYLEIYESWGEDEWGGPAPDLVEMLPELANPTEIWGLITEPDYIWCDEDAIFSISFMTKYDLEHPVNLEFVEGKIARVWHE